MQVCVISVAVTVAHVPFDAFKSVDSRFVGADTCFLPSRVFLLLSLLRANRQCLICFLVK